MYKLLIVDDNLTHIECVRSYVDWQALGFTQIRTSTNGEDAFEIFERYRPDLVITDVVMPKQNGVILSEKIRRKSSDVHIIFMSCYEEFNYVKHAIDNSITAYIQKPIDSVLLNKAVQKVVNEIEEKRKNQGSKETLSKFLPLVRESILYRMLYSTDFKPSEEMLINAKFSNIKKCILVKYVILNNSDCNQLYKALDTINMTQEGLSAIVITELPNKLTSLVVTEEMTFDDFLDNVISYIHTNIKKLKQELNLDVAVGISNPYASLADTHKMLIQSTSAIESTFNPLPGEIYFYEDFEENSEESTFFNFLELKTDLSALLDSGNQDEIDNFLSKYYPKLPADKNVQVKFLCFTIVITLQILFAERNADISDVLFEGSDLIWGKLHKFETIQDTYFWLKNVLRACCEYIKMTESIKQNHIVKSITEYIDNHYNEVTSLEQIAKELYISSGYARNTFKRYTGQTVFDYLLDVRISKAKTLLSDPEKKVYEVMAMVGYTNKAHFISIFKRKTGLTPKQYRQNLLQKG